MNFIPIPLSKKWNKKQTRILNAQQQQQVDLDSDAKSQSESDQEVSTESTHAKQNEVKWSSGNWPLKEFDGTLEVSQRKIEWNRYKEQFKRVAAVKEKMKTSIKLKFLKIYAGNFLVDVISSLERQDPSLKRNFKETIKALDKYFEQGCDTTRERVKFREMKMKENEFFADWMLRLEKQANYCEFGSQFKDEMLQALYMGSIKEIGEKLYEAATVMNNEYSKIIALGNRLDQARTKAKDIMNAMPEKKDEEVTKPVMAVKQERFKPYEHPFRSYRREREQTENRYQGGRNWMPAYQRGGFQNPAVVPFSCKKCGKKHLPRSCPAYQKECDNCGKFNHFASQCRYQQNNEQSENRSSWRKTRKIR